MEDRRNFIKKIGALGIGVFGFKNGSAEGVDEYADLGHSMDVNMNDYQAPKLDVVRVGFVGLGNRGGIAVPRINHIKNVSINALCDIRPEKAYAAQKTLAQSHNTHSPAIYTGKNDWKKLCERRDIDVVYICTQWDLHIPIATYAMECGKHVALEVGPAFSVSECWRLVKASERYQRHCIFLENCCYDFFELLTLNMARKGFFGEIIHCDGAYIHDIAESLFEKDYRYNYWRLRENAGRNGNLYPTHGLGPICNALNINRGDKLDFLVSMSSKDFTLKKIQKNVQKSDLPKSETFSYERFRGNMNTSIIQTTKGKTIMLQHDTSSPRVYSRIYQISGTEAAAQKYPLPGKISVGHEDWLSQKEMEEIERKFTLPLVKKMGEIAKQIGGHGGMDFLMDWRWVDCLRNGLPIDHNVYDAALWRVIAPLTEESVSNRSRSIRIPDFTRGNWKKNKPSDFSIEHGNLSEVKGGI